MCIRDRPIAGRAVAGAVLGGAAEELAAVGGGDAAGLGDHGDEVAEHHPVDDGPPAVQVGAGVEEGEHPVVLLEDVEVLAGGGGEDVAALAALPVVDADPVEQGDGLGGEQRRVGPRGVLVVPGREGQALLLDELAAVGLVPHHLEQVEQVAALVEGEGVGAGPGEHGGGRGAHHPAVPVAAGVVVDQQVGVAGGAQAGVGGGQQVGGEGVVAVEEQQVVAGGEFQAGVAGRAEADVPFQVADGDPVVPGGGLVEDGAAAVGRAVVDGDQFEIGEGLVEDRLQTGREVLLDGVDGHDHAEPRHLFTLLTWPGQAQTSKPGEVGSRPVPVRLLRIWPGPPGRTP